MTPQHEGGQAVRTAEIPHHAQHEELGFLRHYVFSTDHKIIGIQYTVTGFLFLLFGFCLMMMMRWQLAYPGQAIPLLGNLLGDSRAPGGVMLPEFYNQLGAMHGTIMVFLGVVPIGVGGFGNFVLPLQIGAADMAFPRLNMMSYQIFVLGGLVMLASFFLPGGAAQSGWTSYAPLSDINPGQTAWGIGMVLIITSSLLGALNFITTTIQLRAPGMTFWRFPFFVWAQFVTAFLLLLAFPPLEAATVMQIADRVLGASFFLPTGLVVSGQPMAISGGGNPLLWQHLFWFLAHPEVYVLILPALGIVAEVITCNTRRPLWGYRAMVYSILFLGFMSFIVWAHHMFITGMGNAMATFFQTTTMIISIPSVVILTALLLSLWGGSIRFNTPMLFALGFLPMFGIGGLTGLPLGLAPADIHLHDTYYVIGHFHYVVAPGTIFAFFAGIYYWYPKATGRKMNEALGRVHFWLSLLFMNGVFMPMFWIGLAGVSRRLYDNGATYGFSPEIAWLTEIGSWSAWLLGLSQLPFLVNFFWSLRHGEAVDRNPWQATTVEWQAPSPPPHGNFDHPPIVYRDAYDYSPVGYDRDFIPQTQEA
jgi:cytochrome c oxidase subunit 1